MNITNTAIQNPAQKINPKAVTRIQSTASGTVTNSRMKRRRAMRAIVVIIEGARRIAVAIVLVVVLAIVLAIVLAMRTSGEPP